MMRRNRMYFHSFDDLCYAYWTKYFKKLVLFFDGYLLFEQSCLNVNCSLLGSYAFRIIEVRELNKGKYIIECIFLLEIKYPKKKTTSF